MRKQIFGPIALTLALLGCGDSSDPGTAADWVVLNADVYTADKRDPKAQAFAIKGERFVYVGDNAGAEHWAGDGTRIVDLAGKQVLPGLIDSHTHPGYIDLEEYGPELPDSSPEDLLAAVKTYAEQNPDKEWLRLCCWPNKWYVDGKEGPRKEDLDAIVPDRPVWITSEAWHSYWLNSKALEVLGIDDDTRDPRPGVAVYHRDDSGGLTGWVKEGAGWQHIFEQFDISDPAAHKKSVKRFLDTLSEFGVTTVYDASNFEYADQIYRFLSELDRAGELPLRYEGTFAVYVPKRRQLAIDEMQRFREQYGGNRLQFNTIKLFMDGVNENRSGAMLEPYSDNPDYLGNTMLSVEELRDFLIELHESEFDLHIHSIGDLATRTALDGVEAAQQAVGEGFYPRVSLSHLELVDPDDWPRFAELGVTANFTPWWHGFDTDTTVPEAFGKDRINRTYIARPLFESGARVTFSSDDWRLDVLSPFLGMEVAHNRQYPRPWVEAEGGDIRASRAPQSEQLDIPLLIDGYTIHGAWPLRMENDIGSIESGKLADFIVLDDSLFDMDRYQIHTVKPSAVIMEGKLINGELP